MYGRTGYEIAMKQIEFTRKYTLSLLKDIDDDLWLVKPAGSPTHLAWQVGHLAMAEFMLTMFRARGKHDNDEQLIPKSFLKLFLKGTTPEDDGSKYPAPPEILEVFHNVHQQLLIEAPTWTDEQLDQPVVEPRSVCETVLGSMFFCSSHEMLHAGQIGLLRRLHGKAPIR